jgi:hypothetical protein
MVTTLRAERLGAESSGLGFSTPLVATPHSAQNFAAGVNSAPQLPQRGANAAPHSGQNFAPSGRDWPQTQLMPASRW